MSKSIIIETELNQGLSHKPKYYAYNGSWHNVNKCEDCEMIGLYEDMHEVNPCPNCGGRVKRNGAGQWTGTWGSTGLFTSGWSDGTWELRKGVKA